MFDGSRGRTSTLLFFLVALGSIGTSSQQNPGLQDSRSHGTLKDSTGTIAVEPLDSLCGDGDYEAGAICLECLTIKEAIASATDCCRRKDVFEMCVNLVNRCADDNEDNEMEITDEDNNDGGVFLPLESNKDDEANNGETESLELEEEDKRKSPFLGKRRSPFLGKRRSPFLGKRRSPFLGKRRSPFLGKRRSPFLGKRRSPFLGKRDMGDSQ